MLDFLHIENIAVIKKLDINFGNGFNVLTGETGAGKSIIIDSINMLLGAKISKDLIRHGQNHAVVSALFSDVNEGVYELCDELGVYYDKEDVFSISRSYTIDGKNTVKINSTPATLMQLKAVGAKLINIHGQNENQSFMNKANHIRLLDEYAEAFAEVESYSQIYSKLNAIKQEINSLVEENKQKDTMIDILQYQIKEIALAKFKDLDEEEKLIELRKKLKGAEKIVKNSSTVYKALLQNESGVSATVLIEKAIEALNRISDIEAEAVKMVEKLSNFKYEIEDIAESAKGFCTFDGVSDPQKSLEQVEDRLALIQKLERKYGSNIEEILKFKENAELKLKNFEDADNKLEDLKFEYKKLYADACVLASKLHEKRTVASKELSKLVKEALVFLDMPKVQFLIEVKETQRDGKLMLNSLGCDDVEFMIATNVGEDLTQMNKIASGGELARIMLALKSALTDKNGAQTIIFDEIDTGVSGSTSQKIGVKLAKISKNTQTFCVTHSAQIASLAENHYFIKKSEVDGRAETNITLLSDDERVDEIARIIGGIDLTCKQFDAAKELIYQSKELLKALK
ncbi:MAG: DNA repair protein RecN [Ruminococcaceae bacterium]|nr:DNA repair protein RecN [Oscillospiraceae bacterium]